MTTTETISGNTASQDAALTLSRLLTAALSATLGSAVEAAPHPHGTDGPVPGAGDGLLVSGLIARDAGNAPCEIFLEEALALSLAGALLARAAAGLDEALTALAPLATPLIEAAAAAAGGAMAPSGAGPAPSLRVGPLAPMPAEGARLVVHVVAGGAGGRAVFDGPAPAIEADAPMRPSEILLDLELPFALTLGSVEMELGEIQRLAPGGLVPLGRAADGPVSLLVGGRVIARGVLVTVDGCFAIKVDSVETEERRLKTLARVDSQKEH